MNLYLEAALLALAVSAGGTILGALLAMAVRSTKRILSCALLGFAAGLILALILLDMLHEAWELGGPVPVLVGIVLGGGVLFFIMRRTHGGHVHEVEEAEASEIAHKDLIQTGLLLAAGMSIHNLPQGIAVGSALLTGVAGGLSLLLFLHNIPEGMAMAIPLKIAKAGGKRIIFVAFLTAVPTILGALIGAAVSNVSDVFVAGSFAFAAGAMALLAIVELIPQSAALADLRMTIVSVITGFAAGGLLIWLLHE